MINNLSVLRWICGLGDNRRAIERSCCYEPLYSIKYEVQNHPKPLEISLQPSCTWGVKVGLGLYFVWNGPNFVSYFAPKKPKFRYYSSYIKRISQNFVKFCRFWYQKQVFKVEYVELRICVHVELGKWQNGLHIKRLHELRRWMGGWGVEPERPVAPDQPPRKKISTSP